ncbi:hypothetical protein DFH06DRAFT_1329107 [Mycena polygramma]|nr:hypothetical protein DFH06DRAFT_1329107 [Mycena polygramma]
MPDGLACQSVPVPVGLPPPNTASSADSETRHGLLASSQKELDGLTAELARLDALRGTVLHTVPVPVPAYDSEIPRPSLRLALVHASNRPPLCTQRQTEFSNIRARLDLQKTETPAEREVRVHWEVVVCAIEALDMYNWALHPEAAAWVGPKRRRYGARWHEWSDVRHSALQDTDADGTEARRLLAAAPLFIKTAYTILLTERQLRVFPLSLSLDHPWITKWQLGAVCERLGVPEEARAVMLGARNMNGRMVFKDF